VDAEEEVAHGLMTYFDKALPMLLLYRNEQDQATDVSGGRWLPGCCTRGAEVTRLQGQG